jgi:5-methylcytosine-specific restriction enzyme A
MARREFPKSVRVAVIKRATKDGVIYCEKCKGLAKRFQIDHVRPDGLLGEPVLENAELICEPCWAVKNPADTTAIARAKRLEANHLGARATPPKSLQSASMPQTSQARSRAAARQERGPRVVVPRRSIYGDA